MVALRRHPSASSRRNTNTLWPLCLAAVLAIYTGTMIVQSGYSSPYYYFISNAPLEADIFASSSGSSSVLLLDWPGRPVEALGHPLVQKGTSFVANSRQLLLDNLEEFLQVFHDRPDKINLCGIRINHAYALYITTKYLQPTSIIESGVNAGQSTYFLRAAAPHARIYAIDPLEEPICGQDKRWIDEVNTVYYTGKKFQDIGDIDWAGKIEAGEVDPKKTLVFLDDHLAVFDRFVALMKNGFEHVLCEDNYKVREGSTRQDKAGWTPKQILNRVDDDSIYFWNNLKSYAEFPPLVAPILAMEWTGPRKAAGGFMVASDTNTDIVEPLLRADKDQGDRKIYERVCDKLGIDASLRDDLSYMQVMNYNQFTYLELFPMAPRLRPLWAPPVTLPG